MFRIIQTYSIWLSYSLASLFLCFWLAWHLSAQINFLYPVWYSMLKIDQTIEQTMPKHLYKKEFIATDSIEHQRLFSEIVQSIQNKAEGLEKIYFYTPSGVRLGKLLTHSEITHLKDVANLIQILNWTALVVFLFCLVVLAFIIFYRLPMPAVKRLSYITIAGIGSIVIAILFLGAKKFFYWLHTVVFPSEHQWFFYYEESLMSTLMKAPDLFAPISVLLLIVGMSIWLVHLLLISRLGLFK